MSVLSEHEYLENINRLIDERLELIPCGDSVGRAENVLYKACRHLCVSDHAKRARPLLSLYAHWLFSLDIMPQFFHIGVAAEFIHAASLLHDDIVDEADRRRGKPSVNNVFGNATAVIAGDFLLTEAFDLLRLFDRGLSERAIDAVRQMTKATILELNARGNIEMDITLWRTIAYGKTGVLFSWCGYAAGTYLKNNDAAHKLSAIGEHIGMIFQLIDDLKDFQGDGHLKDVCRDIRNLELSLPVILAIEEDNHIKNQFKNAFSSGFIDEHYARELSAMVMNSRALKKVSQILTHELTHVVDLLSTFEDSKGKDHIDQFMRELAIVSA